MKDEMKLAKLKKWYETNSLSTVRPYEVLDDDGLGGSIKIRNDKGRLQWYKRYRFNIEEMVNPYETI